MSSIRLHFKKNFGPQTNLKQLVSTVWLGQLKKETEGPATGNECPFLPVSLSFFLQGKPANKGQPRNRSLVSWTVTWPALRPVLKSHSWLPKAARLWQEENAMKLASQLLMGLFSRSFLKPLSAYCPVSPCQPLPQFLPGAPTHSPVPQPVPDPQSSQADGLNRGCVWRLSILWRQRTFQLPSSKSFWPKIRNWIKFAKQGSHSYTSAFQNGISNMRNKARF